MSKDNADSGQQSTRPRGGAFSHDQYTSFRKILIEHNASVSRLFIRHLLALSSGAVMVSVLFVDNVVPETGAVCEELLVFSWISLVGCIAATLVNLLLAGEAAEKAIIRWDAVYVSSESDNDESAPILERAIDALNWISCVLFILGLGLMCYFAVVNLKVAI